MSKMKNYSKIYSNPDVEPKDDVVVEETTIEEPVVEAPVAPPMLTGVVTDCVKLNVRKTPAANGMILDTIAKGTEVKIDEFKSTNDFYKVCVASGIEGFCMKKFITVKQ